jgi:probable rRNA maturation factor
MSRSKRSDPRVSVFNRQRKLPVDRKTLADFAAALAETVGGTPDFCIVLVSDAAIRKLNRRFRNEDHPTDVLSFSYGSLPGQGEETHLGDIVISVESADRQKQGDLTTELCRLSLHGLLHLLGYDHEADDGAMARKERRLRKELGLP